MGSIYSNKNVTETSGNSLRRTAGLPVYYFILQIVLYTSCHLFSAPWNCDQFIDGFYICIASYSPQTFISLCCSAQGMHFNIHVWQMMPTLENNTGTVSKGGCSLVMNSPLVLLRRFSKSITSVNLNLIAQK